LLNKSQGDLYNTELDERLKNKFRENKLKEIFSSKGFVLSSMNERYESPTKLKSKITSKEYDLTIFETNLSSKQDFKKYRKNSCHNFHNKSGFYMI
jgi:hypothetical protein